MEGIRRTPRRGNVHREAWSKRKIEERERLTLRNKVKEEKHLRDIRGLEGRYWNENVSGRLNGLREIAETTISCGDLYLPERSKGYTSSS